MDWKSSASTSIAVGEGPDAVDSMGLGLSSAEAVHVSIGAVGGAGLTAVSQGS